MVKEAVVVVAREEEEAMVAATVVVAAARATAVVVAARATAVVVGGLEPGPGWALAMPVAGLRRLASPLGVAAATTKVCIDYAGRTANSAAFDAASSCYI